MTNPSLGILRIHSTSLKVLQIQLFNVQGKIVQKVTMQGALQLQLGPGVYFVHVHAKEQGHEKIDKVIMMKML